MNELISTLFKKAKQLSTAKTTDCMKSNSNFVLLYMLQIF